MLAIEHGTNFSQRLLDLIDGCVACGHVRLPHDRGRVKGRRRFIRLPGFHPELAELPLQLLNAPRGMICNLLSGVTLLLGTPELTA
ncbi:hypothetical protein OG301_04285 [Streptomyces platensis]|uniref:hypothetical protein n=1 Tax=Streptomyces platensis TaxID=58346 RepID=UPI002ED012B1|nr:hypothetical protein OG301_04285 [Streptomyces platensis]